MEVFQETFSSFKLQYFKITSLNIDEDKAEVCFDVKYISVIEGSKEKKIFSGMGDFKLKYEYDYWCINKINIPGISI